MDVVALVGQSGTGKSHRALLIAHEYAADGIIDDGLLIKGTKIMAGYSAKNEQNKIQAVKRAIFSDSKHVREVRESIDSTHFNRILILGTSINMVDRIADKLGIPKPSKYIQIEDIATKTEINKARYARLKEGKHIVPVPTMELKSHYSGYLIDPLIVFFRKNARNRNPLGEKSIVRPAFSYYGKMMIDDAAITDIIILALKKMTAIVNIDDIQTRRDDRFNTVNIKISVDIAYGVHIPTLAGHLQGRIKDKVEYMTGFYVHNIDVVVNKLIKKQTEDLANAR